MKIVDYTGKLNHHQEYIEVIKCLENKCKYIEYVLVDENEIEFLKNLMILLYLYRKKRDGGEQNLAGKAKCID